MEVPRLNSEQLAQLWTDCLDNAEKLSDDAQVLLDAGRHARAFALGELVHEELAKVTALMYAWVRPSEVDWPRFWEQWRTHNFKIQLAIGLDIARQAVKVGTEQVTSESLKNASVDIELPEGLAKQVEALMKRIQVQAADPRPIANQREKALYVDWSDGSVSRPADVITPQMARGMVEAAKSNVAFARWFGSSVLGAFQVLRDHPLYQQVEAMLQEVASRLNQSTT